MVFLTWLQKPAYRVIKRKKKKKLMLCVSPMIKNIRFTCVGQSDQRFPNHCLNLHSDTAPY